MRAGLTKQWPRHCKVPVVLYDYVRPDINALIVARNFPNKPAFTAYYDACEKYRKPPRTEDRFKAYLHN